MRPRGRLPEATPNRTASGPGRRGQRLRCRHSPVRAMPAGGKDMRSVRVLERRPTKGSKTYREDFSLSCGDDLFSPGRSNKPSRTDLACSRLRAAAFSNSSFTNPIANTSAIQVNKTSSTDATNPAGLARCSLSARSRLHPRRIQRTLPVRGRVLLIFRLRPQTNSVEYLPN